MDIDEKKRKIEEIEEPQVVNLDEVLKEYNESNVKMCKLIALLTHKIVNLEKVFNKDLFKTST